MSRYYRTPSNMKGTMSPMNIITTSNFNRPQTPTISRSPSTQQLPQNQTYSRMPSTTIINSQITAPRRSHMNYTPTRVMISHQISQGNPNVQAPVRIRASPGRRPISRSPSNIVSRVSDVGGTRGYASPNMEEVYPINGYSSPGQQPIIFNHVTISPRDERDAKKSVVWRKFEDVEDELKPDCKEVIGNMANSMVDQSHGILDMYNILSRAENREVLDYNQRELEEAKDQFRRANDRHRREIADIIDRVKEMVAENPSSYKELDNISNNVRYVPNTEEGNPSIMKKEMIDLSMISDPEITGYSTQKTAERNLMDRKRSEVGLRRTPSYVSRMRHSQNKPRSRTPNHRSAYKNRSPGNRNNNNKGINLTRQSDSPDRKFSFTEIF